MNEYRVVTCCSGYIVYEHSGIGMQPIAWAFSTATEAADKLLELMQAEEAKDAP